MLRLPAFRVTTSIPVLLSYICQDLQPINELPFQRLQGVARDLDCGVVTGVVTFSVDVSSGPRSLAVRMHRMEE
jgi:hypothetical protein